MILLTKNNTMSRSLLLSMFFLIVGFIQLHSQEPLKSVKELGFELQQYPTGYMLAFHAEYGFAEKHSLDLRMGYNGLDHLSFGPNDEEKGGGPGFSLGYNYFFKPDFKKWYVSYRTDLWWNEVNWRNFDENDVVISEGTTHLLVLQPTILGGYNWIIKDRYKISPTLAVGAEINVKSDGEPVGQGPIILWGLKLATRI